MRRIRELVLFGALVAGSMTLATPIGVQAQSAGSVTAAETWPRGDAADVASIDAIIAALYDVISGPAGQARDWDRFRSLFIPQARLIPTFRGPNGEVGRRVWSPDEYAAQAGASLEQSGFFEVEISRTTERFGEVAHAFSTYESRRNADDVDPFTRGINSIQLMYDGDRWYVINVFWAGERDDLRIPDEYLPGR